MNAPSTPQGPSPEDERDQSRVRDLLAALPDPGPMPDDVTARIQAMLASEQQQRSADHDNVTPLVARSSSTEDDVIERVDTRGERRSSGRVRWLRPLAAVGAAAAVGVGALAGYQALSSDSAPPVSDARPAPAASSTQGNPLDKLVLNRISIQNSGRSYSQTGLATQAAALKATPTSTLDPAQAEAQGTGPVGTPVGLLSCMRAMGSELLGSGVPDKISADLGTYEGQPAVVVLVTDGGSSRAWVLARTCTSAKAKIAGPTAVV